MKLIGPLPRARRQGLAAAVLIAGLVLTGCTPGDAAPVAALSPAATQPATPASPAPSPSPTPEPTPDPFEPGPVDVLFVGTDSRDPESLGGRADVIMLAHLPETRDKLYLVSFTRDMWVNIPGAGEGKINSAYSAGGLDRLKSTVSRLMGGAEIDATVQTNFNGFINITRALGGIEVENQHTTQVTVQSTGRVVHFPAGTVTLENTDGLIYVRERKTLPYGDLDRTERQRATFAGILDRVAEVSADEAALAVLIGHLTGNTKITGELTPSEVSALVPLAQEIGREDVVGLMAPITGFGTKGGQSVNLVDGPKLSALGQAVRDDTLDAYVSRYGTDYVP